MFDESAVADQPTTETVEQPEQSDFPSTEVGTESGGETQPTGETVDTETTESTYQLPDEQLKVYPDPVLQEFAENRYPDLAKMLADGALSEQSRQAVRQIIHDKLNGDIYIERLRAESEAEPEEEEEAEPEKPADPPPVDQAAAMAHVEARLNQVVDQITDPKVAVAFVERLGKADAIKDPQERAIAVTKALTYGMANAMRDLLPAFLDGPGGWLEQRIGGYLNSNFEGFGDSYKANAYQSAWEGIRASDPKFAALPAYNTPEWMEAAREAASILPGFENAVYTDKATGRPLSPAKNFAEKAKAMASILTRTRGAAVTEAVKAVETGKRMAADSANRKSLGKLGAGQSSGKITAQPVTDPLKAAIAAQRADADPFAALKQNK